MKAVGMLLILLLMTTCLMAQGSGRSQTSSGVAVLEFNWHKNFHRPDWDRQGTAYRVTRGILSSERQEVSKEYVYKVTIQNNSPKTISAIDWDYVFIDPATQQEVARHRFHSTEQVRPGKKRSLVGTSISPQTRVVKVDSAAENPLRPFQEKVVLQSVSYADGAVWRQL
jgi:hypothetical protein